MKTLGHLVANGLLAHRGYITVIKHQEGKGRSTS